MLNEIYNTDCISFMKDMVENNKKVTHVITDIPYDVVNRESAGIRVFDKENADELSFNLTEFCSLINSVVEENVVIFCATEQLTHLSKTLEGFGLHTSIGVWEKSNPSPVNGQFMWLSGIECFIIASKNKPLTKEMKNIIARTTSGKSKSHKTEKPVALLKQVIELVSKEGDSIYDPCFGSASTLVALNIESFHDLIKYSILNNNDRNYKDEVGSVCSNSSNNSGSLVLSENESEEERGVSSIYGWINNNSHKLDESIERQLRNKKKEEKGDTIDKEINNGFNGNEILYWTFTDFINDVSKNENYLSLDNNSGLVFQEMLKDIINDVVTKIWNKIYEKIQISDKVSVENMISETYLNIENNHSKIRDYVSKVSDDNKKFFTTAYKDFFISQGEGIHPSLSNAVRTAIEIHIEDKKEN